MHPSTLAPIHPCVQAKIIPLFRVGDLDDNGDMDLSEFEFVVMLLSRIQPPKMVRLWEWFWVFSELNKGYIDYLEYSMLMTGMGYFNVNEEKAFKLFDSTVHAEGKYVIE